MKVRIRKPTVSRAGRVTVAVLLCLIARIPLDADPETQTPLPEAAYVSPPPGATNAPVIAADVPGIVPAEPVAPRTVPDGVDTKDETVSGSGLRLNFQNAPLIDVLQYLSEAAGFVVIQDVQVGGTVSVISRQPLDAEEAFNLLNTLLADKGYLALRNGRILKIVDRTTAPKQLLPVYTASQPDQIPKNDEMATMIIPVGFASVNQLIDNLAPLMPEGATLSANESCNAILITDAQANARRMAEIIKALDTSVSALSTIRVFALHFADAKETAEVIVDLFAAASAGGRSSGGSSSRYGGRFSMMRPGGDSDDRSRDSSRSRRSSAQVVAVADERSNSIIVGAPEDTMPTIEELVSRIDTNIQDITEIRLFHLEHSDASELADLVNELYDENDNNRSRQPQSFGGFPPFYRGGDSRRGSDNENNRGQRSLQQSRVVAIGDPRTNTLIVRAARETMLSLAEMIGRLDASEARTQRVHVYPLKHADVDNVARVLEGMFEGTGTGTQRSSQSSSSRNTGRLSERSADGASTDTQNVFGGRGTR